MSNVYPKYKYMIVLEWDEAAREPAEIIEVRDVFFAHETFNLIAKDMRRNHERYGSAKHEWFLSLYDPDDITETEYKTFTVKSMVGEPEIVWSVRTTAMRRRFLSQRKLEGLDE